MPISTTRWPGTTPGLSQHHCALSGRQASIYTLTESIRKVPTPTLIICGDEDDNCVEPSLFLKKHLPAAGLAIFPKAGHVLNLEEPALFNEWSSVLSRSSRPDAGRCATKVDGGLTLSFRGEAKPRTSDGAIATRGTSRIPDVQSHI